MGENEFKGLCEPIRREDGKTGICAQAQSFVHCSISQVLQNCSAVRLGYRIEIGTNFEEAIHCALFHASEFSLLANEIPQ